MNISLRGKTYWVDVRVDGQRIRQSLGTTDYSEALRKAADVVAGLTGAPSSDRTSTVGEPPQKPRVGTSMTVMRMLELTFDERWSKPNDPRRGEHLHSIRKREATYLLVAERFGADRMVHTITDDDLKQFVKDELARGLKHATVNKHLFCLTTGLRHVIEHHGVNLPIPSVKGFKIDADLPKYMSAEQLSTLLAAEAHAPHWQTLWLFLYETGARLRNALDTPWANIFWDDRLVIVGNTKNRNPQAIPMSDELTVRLRELQKRGDAKPLIHNYESAGTRFRRLRDRLGLDGISIHKFRHTRAIHLLDAGADIRAVQQWLGHKDINTTTIYARVLPKRLRELSDLMAPKLKF